MLNTGKIYLHKILRNNVCFSTVRRFIYTKYWGILYVEHCGKIYLHKILRNTLCWTLWEDLFTQNTEEYFMLNTGEIYLHKILRNNFMLNTGEIYLHKILMNNFMLNTVGRFIYTKYWGILYVEHCGEILMWFCIININRGKENLNRITKKRCWSWTTHYHLTLNPEYTCHRTDVQIWAHYNLK